MKRMEVIGVTVPDPDSQFRLRACGCLCTDVRYLKIRAAGREVWAVRCFGCGKTGDIFMIRHDAQVYWNTNMAVRPDNRRVIHNGKV